MRNSEQTGVRVSDHAIIRYLERVEGLDLDMGGDTRDRWPAAACGAKILRKGGHAYVIERGNIVTVIPADRQRLPQRKR